MTERSRRRGCVAWGFALLCWLSPIIAGAATDPRVVTLPGYVAEERCQSCHQEQAKRHLDSHHARAMELATKNSVLGRFPDEYKGPGPWARFLQKADRYLVETEGADGKRAVFPIEYTFGVDPLQQYLVALPGGRLQAFDVAWDVHQKRWFWLGEGKAPAPNDALHWSGAFYRWNRNCAECHSTALQTGFQPASGEYRTRYVETHVGCQSCHGGGEAHVRWAETDRSAADMGLAKGAVLDTCASCHSRRVRIAEGFQPGKSYLDHYSPSLLDEGLYFPDGQIRDEVFEFGSFSQSRMAQAGVTCLDCHDSHSGKLRRPGNEVCTQCHSPKAKSRFGDLAPRADFDSQAHLRHPPGSGGSACVDCHMPTRTYMKVDARRDHALVIPRPDISQAYGTPNACTSCHVNRDDAWASKHMDRWYGTGWRSRPSTAHAFAATWSGSHTAAEELRALLARKDIAGFTRGSALQALGQVLGPQATDALRSGVASADPLVRLGAAEGALGLAPEQRPAVVAELAGDSVRAVRLAALRALAAAPGALFSEEQRKHLARAEGDLDLYLAANADTAEAHTQVGNIRFDQQRLSEAEDAFRLAIELDRSHPDAYLNLAELLRVLNREADSQAMLDLGLSAVPDNAELSHARGLARVRAGKLTDALEDLRRAWTLSPANNRYAYTQALALEALGRVAEAYDSLATGTQLDHGDPQLLRVQLSLALKLGRTAQARQHAKALAQLQPGDPEIKRLLHELQ